MDFLAGMKGSYDGDDGIPAAAMELPEMKDANLSSGYKSWIVTCDLCGTKYLAEVDVEPFVHDFSLTRFKDGKATTQFGETVEL